MQIEAIQRQWTAELVVERITQVIKEQSLSAGDVRLWECDQSCELCPTVSIC